jgi:hypothetical protein
LAKQDTCTTVQLYNVHAGPIVHVHICRRIYCTYDGKNVAEYVRLGDGPVNVGDHDLVCVMPQVDVTPATGESQQRLNVTAKDKQYYFHTHHWCFYLLTSFLKLLIPQ